MYLDLSKCVLVDNIPEVLKEEPPKLTSLHCLNCPVLKNIPDDLLAKSMGLKSDGLSSDSDDISNEQNILEMKE